MSLKLVPFENFGAVSHSPSIATMAVSVAVCEIAESEWRDLENQVRGHSRSLKMPPFDRPYRRARALRVKIFGWFLTVVKINIF